MPGVFKPSCSTPFDPFLSLVSVYWPFQLYFIPKTLHNTSVFSSVLTAYFYLTSHSPVFIYNTTLLHILLTLCGPPWNRLLVPGVFKPSCSTPFTPFLCLVSVYWPFQLYFIPKTLHNTSVFSSLLTAYFYLTGHSPVFIYNSSSYSSSCSLWSPSDPASLPYAASRVGGE